MRGSFFACASSSGENGTDRIRIELGDISPRETGSTAKTFFRRKNPFIPNMGLALTCGHPLNSCSSIAAHCRISSEILGNLGISRFFGSFFSNGRLRSVFFSLISRLFRSVAAGFSPASSFLKLAWVGGRQEAEGVWVR